MEVWCSQITLQDVFFTLYKHPANPPGLSKALGLNQTHVTTHSMGTITHMPPELFKWVAAGLSV
jgi:hypothetical protein